MYTAEGELTGVVGLIEDLTELKTLEAKRRRLDRLAALGEMSAVVAHELRNPVAGIAAGVRASTGNAHITEIVSIDGTVFSEHMTMHGAMA